MAADNGEQTADAQQGEDAQADQRQQARRAFALAQAVMPYVRFTGWRRTQEADSAFVFAGRNRFTNWPTAVYMTADGSITEIRERIPLRAVPRDLRRDIGEEISGLRVSSVERSLREDFDVYYEFDAVLRSGRPVEVEIRADGEDFTLSSAVNN
ncbi:MULTISPECIES: hypothetical protein [unclassified Roseitalea]|uniref:hypothetical protein n=1 Tax=unclassified Roseitalea TaxID=2639107 RepID=UPI00273F6B26|nr:MULTISPECIES: hypothetical protein [unclassified Roseitalea]